MERKREGGGGEWVISELRIGDLWGGWSRLSRGSTELRRRPDKVEVGNTLCVLGREGRILGCLVSRELVGWESLWIQVLQSAERSNSLGQGVSHKFL